MEPVYQTLTHRALNLYNKHSQNHTIKRRRVLIALAGPPGCGKSTVAAEVVKRVHGHTSRRFAAVLPMDGFHLTRATLEAMSNHQEAIARRGAEWTFDAQGVIRLVKALHETREDFSIVHEAPSFDHAIKDPVERSILITSDVELVILEGNWLLLDQDPWSEISKLVDDTWFVDVDDEVALERVAKRHLASGIEKDWESAVFRTQSNDLVNGALVRKKLVPPGVHVQSVEEPFERQ